MNKYNVRAIRKDLDDCMLHSKWNMFQIRFQSLSCDLQRAVVECNYKPQHNANSKSSSNNNNNINSINNNNNNNGKRSLLHKLCRYVGSRNHPTVPMEVFQLVIQACPHLLSITPTPLSILLDRQATVAVIQCILDNERRCCDTKQQSLTTCCDGKGETPLLQAVRQLSQHQGYSNHDGDDIVRLLVEHDAPYYQSLLIPSKKRNRVPLYYVANHELSLMDLENNNNKHKQEEEEEFPKELKYMLLKTHAALTMQQQHKQQQTGLNNQEEEEEAEPSNSVVVNETIWQNTETDNEQCGKDDDDSRQWCRKETHRRDSESLLDEDTNDLVVQQQKEYLRILFSTIACAHLLADKYTSKLLHFLLGVVSNDVNSLTIVNDVGDTVLHQVCRANQLFLVPLIHLPNHDDDDVRHEVQGNKKTVEPVCLLDYLLKVAPQCLLIYNKDGKLPLHVALETNKPWEMLHRLLATAPETAIQLGGQGKHMALHLAILNYPSENALVVEVQEIWRCFPEAVSILDATAQLFPFQLAAAVAAKRKSLMHNNTTTTLTKTQADSCSKSNKHSKQQQNGPAVKTENIMLEGLSAIYFLLRACPQVLGAFSSLK